MKKVLVIGVGAQGSTIAKRLDEDPAVAQIVCADADAKAAETLGRSLSKATARQLDAGRAANVVEAARGCDIIVNGLPLEYDFIVMEAALAVKAAYLDMAGPMPADIGFEESYRRLFSDWHARFQDKGLTALVGAGSSPGLANVIAREAVDRMDACRRIGIYLYDGVWANRFTPFWWSPEVALGDMRYVTFRCENGVIVTDRPFSRPEMMRFRGIERPVRMVDHEHDEPVTMGLLRDTVLKGVRDVDFKYGGPAVEISESLYNLGLLSLDPVTVKGAEVVPMDLVLQLMPPAPKYPDEIRAILDGGLSSEEGVFLVRVEGVRNDTPIRIDNYLSTPGPRQAFELARISHESYLTGQSAAVFVKMLVNDVFTQPGLFSPEQLGPHQRSYCFRELARLNITVDQIVETRLH